jgi:hypothetical protein
VNDAVRALEEYHETLIAGGDFTQAGAIAANRLARWTGSNWETLGSGTDSSVHSLQAQADNLFVGGEFYMAGERPSMRVAWWTDLCFAEVEIFEDLLYTTLGCASLVLSPGALLLDELGQTGDDGVSIDTGESCRVWSTKWDTPAAPVDAYIETSGFGPVGGTPEDTLGTMRVTMDNPEGTRVRLGYDIPNCTSVLYQALRNGAVVASVTGIVGDVLATSIGSADPMVDVEQIRIWESNHRRTFIARWSAELNVQLPTQLPVQATEVRVLPVELSSDYDTISRVTVRASGVPQIRFVKNDVASAEEDGSSRADRLELLSAYPNPIRGGATIRYSVPAGARVLIDVFDVQGRRVRRVLDCLETKGLHQAAWDGRSDRGRSLPTGVYFVRIAAGRETRSCQVVLAR